MTSIDERVVQINDGLEGFGWMIEKAVPQPVPERKGMFGSLADLFRSIFGNKNYQSKSPTEAIPEPNSYRCVPIGGATEEVLGKAGIPFVMINLKSGGIADPTRGYLVFVGKLRLMEDGVEARRGSYQTRETVPYDDFLPALSTFQLPSSGK